ncbi:hypothetical protein JAO82_04980 [Pontibaca sp. S1109L]|uniref:histidine kinase n=1 Tax=Pontibaca salina TaxID=2795731 RepID=A0A934M121_9RHOB|nr:hypothetical protein [Pontibaca salina]
MVAALYTRLKGREQFAADIAPEIKTPLASLQSAVNTLRRVGRDDQRERLLDVINHDMRRLHRSASDIARASRLDAESGQEEQQSRDLLDMVLPRFYSQRPEQNIGNKSGLGLAIFRQLIEAYDGILWAENIRPTKADIISEPSGARFVESLPR